VYTYTYCYSFQFSCQGADWSSEAAEDHFNYDDRSGAECKNQIQLGEGEFNPVMYSNKVGAAQHKDTTSVSSSTTVDYFYDCTVPIDLRSQAILYKCEVDQAYTDTNGSNTAEGMSFENWDFTNGYYDELGNYIPYDHYHAGSNLGLVGEHNTEEQHYYVSQESANLDSDNYNPNTRSMNAEEETTDSANDQRWADDYAYNEDAAYDSIPYDSMTLTEPCDIPGLNLKRTHDHTQPIVQYNFAYHSAENLSASDENLPKLQRQSDGLNPVSRRRSFRRQTSTIDYNGSDGPIEPSLDTHISDVSSQSKPSAYTTTRGKDFINSQKPSLDQCSGWMSGEYPSNRVSSMIMECYDASAEDDVANNLRDETGSGSGPVHMDSLESNTSEPGGRDSDANEKFEAQYWQRQKERIAQQATMLHVTDSRDYFGLDSYEIEDQGPQVLELMEKDPFSPSVLVGSQVKGDEVMTDQYNGEWRNLSLNKRNSSDQRDEWINRQDSVKAKNDVFALQLTRQSTQNDSIEDVYFSELESHVPRMRKHSTISLDSQGDTLPPTSPPASDSFSGSRRGGFGEENID